MENTAINERIKELRYKNEIFYKRILTRKTKYVPAEINIDIKIKQEKNTTVLIRLLAFAIAVIIGFSVDVEKDGVQAVYKILFAFVLFFMPSFLISIRKIRYEEIKFLQSLLTKV